MTKDDEPRKMGMVFIVVRCPIIKVQLLSQHIRVDALSAEVGRVATSKQNRETRRLRGHG